DVVKDFERRELGADRAAKRKDRSNDQCSDTEIKHPGGGEFAGSENHWLGAKNRAQYEKRRKFTQGARLAVLCDQVGEADHGRQRKRAIADEVRGHVKLHPPTFEGRHKGLDLEGVAGEGIPKQEDYSRADNQHHKTAQRTGGISSLVVQIEQSGDQGEKNKNLVQIADRYMPDIGA